MLKFGSSLLKDPSDLPAVAAEVARCAAEGYRVVAVVSAFRGETDGLFEHGRRVGGDTPQAHALAMLVALGEARSVAMLTLALCSRGLAARGMSAKDVGLIVRGPALDAQPVEVRGGPILRELARVPVVVVPGFVGCDRRGRIALLGRGGSDLTAIALAHALRARTCRLLKDVDGVFDADPARGQARHLPALTYAQALTCAGRAIQPKALEYAERHAVEFEVASPGSPRRTCIGPAPAMARIAGEM